MDKIIITAVDDEHSLYDEHVNVPSGETEVVIFMTSESNRSIAMSKEEFREFVKACQRFQAVMR